MNSRSGFLQLMLAAAIVVSVNACSIGSAEKLEADSSSVDSAGTGKLTEVEHLNLVIIPDLSNRIDSVQYPRQLNDQKIIQTITEIFPKSFRHNGKLVNQKERMTLRLINQKEVADFGRYESALNIDLGVFAHKQGERMDYINGKAEKNLKGDLKDFNRATADMYAEAYARKAGADVYTFMNQTFDETILKISNPLDSKVVKDKARTVVVLLTDGYLEAGNYDSKKHCEGNQCYFLSPRQIKRFRAALSRNKGKSIEEVMKAEGFGIKPVHNPHLKNVEVLCLEFFDRSKNQDGSASIYPTDYEITKAFWEDWMLKSGVKRVKIVEAKTRVEDVRRVVEDFLFDNSI